MELREGANKVLKGMVVALATAVGLALLLLLCATVPRAAIQDKMSESALWIANHEMIEYVVEDIPATGILYSSDAVWLSIAYDFYETQQLESMIWARYCLWPGEDLNGSLLQSVMNQQLGINQYLRYWHGPAGLMRVLHLFLNIEQIYGILCVVVAALFVALLVLLWRHDMRAEALVLVLAMFMVSAWVVPLGLSYVWVFIVMFVAAFVGVRREVYGASGLLPVLFLVTGEVTAFLDFLTTETLTLTIPLLLVLRARSRRGRKSDFGLVVACCVAWLVGFAGMWAAKWALASAALGIDAMPYVSEHIVERLGGDVGLGPQEFLTATIVLNVRCLSVLDFGVVGILVLCVLVAALTITLFMDKGRARRHIDWKVVLVYVGIALLPYVRYLVLHNHAYVHYFFTYRAQAATVMALCFIVMELIGYTGAVPEETDDPPESGLEGQPAS